MQAGVATSTLRELERAVTKDDNPAAERLGADDDASGLLSSVADNVAALRLRDVTFRYLSETGRVTPDDGWSAAVEVTWRIAGFDRSASRSEVEVAFGPEGRSIAGIAPSERAMPLWLAGQVTSRRTADTLVLSTGSPRTVQKYDAWARTAIAEVHRALGNPDSTLVVEVPDSAAALNQTVGAAPGTYDRIAAVTTSADGDPAPGAPIHVFVNPEVLGELDDVSGQVVMTHEAVHVVTEAPYAAQVELWLLEGFADYVALRDTELPLSRTAGQIIDQVQADGVPDQLPTRAEFDNGSTHLGASYEAAWLVCVTLADHGGEPALVDLYESVLGGADLVAELESALRMDLDRPDRCLAAAAVRPRRRARICPWLIAVSP